MRGTLRRTGAAFVIAAIVLAAHVPAPAQVNQDSLEAVRAAELERQRQEEQERRNRELEEQKRRELAEIERRAREAKEAAGEKLKEERGAMSELRKTERRLSTTRRRLRNLQASGRKLDRELESTRVDLERAQISLAQQRALLARRLRNMYKQGAASELEFLLSTSSIPQLLARWDFLVIVAERDRMLLESVTERKDHVEAAKQKLEVNIDKVQKNETHAARQRQDLASQQKEKSAQVSRIKTQRQAFEAAAEELERTAADIKRLLARLEASRRTGAVPYTGDFAAGKGRLDWPVRGQVVGRFGNEKHPKWGTITVNNGIDIQAAMGTPVRAVAKARVEYTSEDYGTYGQMIILNHGDGYYTLYGHLSEISVVVSQEVAAGATIGRVGDTGSLKGTVLHFEVREGGAALDPLGWLQ